MAEIFIINDLDVSDCVIDINTVNKKNVEEISFIRDTNVYAFQSMYSRVAYEVSFAFDACNREHMQILTRLTTELDGYPFAFIVSPRLETYAGYMIPTAHEYQIYGVSQYSLTIKSDVAQNVVVLSIRLLYFNYLPFVKSFEFISATAKTVRPVVPKNNSQAAIPEFNQTRVKTKTSSLKESNIFNDFFSADYQERLQQVDQLLNQADPSVFGIKYPLFSEEKSRDPDSETITVAPIGERKEETINVSYLDISTDKPEFSNINKKPRAIREVSLVKYNNFGVHNMIGWVHPALQYIGKGGSVLSIVVDNEVLDIVDRSQHPARDLKNALSKLEANYTSFRKYFPYNVLKFDSLINRISPTFGYILDEEEMNASSDSIGEDTHYLVFRESDTRNILKRRKFNRASKAFDSAEVVERILSIMSRIVKNVQNSEVNESVAEVETIDNGNPTFDYPLMERNDLTIELLHDIENRNGLPRDMLYTVMQQESAGNPNAVSHAGAAGLFQFMPPTARDEGLYVNNTVDERFDQFKSAEAAGRYLKKLYSEFGNIEQTLAAYNGGWGNQRGAIRGTKPSTIVNGYPIYAASETIDYVKKITANRDSIVGGYTDVGTVTPRTTPHEVEAAKKLINGMVTNINNEIEEGQVNQIDDVLSLFNSARTSDNQADVQRISSHVHRTAQELIEMARAGNDFLRPYRYSLENSESFHESLQLISFDDNEAIEDLEFKTRLPDLNKYGFSSVQEIPPFFFLKYTPYVDTGKASAMFDKYANVVALNEAYNKSREIAEKQIGENGKLNYRQVELSSGKSEINKVQIPTNVFADQVTEVGEISSGKKDFMNFGGIDEILPEFYTDNILRPNASAIVDVYDENALAQKQAENIGGYFGKGINLAFPSVKVFLVIGDENTFGERFSDIEHEYYEIKGISSLDLVTNNDDNPVDLLVMQLANPGSVYSDAHVLYDILRPRYDLTKAGTSDAIDIRLDQIKIQPGTRLFVKAGYGNDTDELETIFNGIITEVVGEQVIEVIAEGFGRELVAYEHGDDPNNDAFIGSAKTTNIISGALNSGEIEHFGITKLNGHTPSTSIKNYWDGSLGGVFSLIGKKQYFTNIFAEKIENADSSFSLDVSNLFAIGKPISTEFSVYRITPWQMLKEMEFRHPGTLSKPMLYNDRMSFFFGIKEQLYIAKDIANPPRSQYSEGLSNMGSYLRMKPVVNFHILTSENNIISNKLKLNGNFNTVVNVQYWDSVSEAADNDFHYLELKLDDNLRPMAHRRGELSMNGIHKKELALRYGSTYLRREAETMYGGEIIVMGNPAIKAGDFAVIDDSFRGINGIVKVRECTHHYNTNIGYVTKIVPGLYVEESHIDYSDFLIKMYLSSLGIINTMRAHSMYNFGANQNYINSEIFKDIFNQTRDNESFSGFRRESASDQAAAGAFEVSLAGTFAALSAYSIYKVNDWTKQFPKFRSNFAKLARGLKWGTAATANVSSSLLTNSAVFLEGLSESSSKTLRFIGKSRISWAFRLSGIAVSSGARFALGSLLRVGALYLTSPLAVAATIVGLVLWVGVQQADFNLRARQPIKLYPLTQNGIPYVAGIYGYHDGGYLEDFGRNVDSLLEDAAPIIEKVENFIDEQLTNFRKLVVGTRVGSDKDVDVFRKEDFEKTILVDNATNFFGPITKYKGETPIRDYQRGISSGGW